MSGTLKLRINGQMRETGSTGETPLLYVLRDDLGLKGTRFGCGSGECGSCMVLVDGVAEKSCQLPVESLGGKAIETVEALAAADRPECVVQAIVEGQAGQCGYCLSGIVIAATALLRRSPFPTENDVRSALDGNLCRCGSHARIVGAVFAAAGSGGAT